MAQIVLHKLFKTRVRCHDLFRNWSHKIGIIIGVIKWFEIRGLSESLFFIHRARYNFLLPTIAVHELYFLKKLCLNSAFTG